MSKTALVVDDSVTMRQMISFTLSGAGFDVVEADDGAVALQQMDRRPVDVIITDLNMPVMDGISFIRQARTRPDSKHTPIIMLTTESAPERKQEGKAAGATGWIVKPFDPQSLVQVMSKVLR